MKKFITIILIIIVYQGTYGQFTYGPRVGFGATSIENADMGVGFHAGVFINAEIFDRIGLQPEVVYSIQTGKKEYDDGTGGTIEETYNHQAIDVPIYVFFPLSDHLIVLAGPMFSSLSSSTREVDGTKDDSYSPTIEGTGFAVGIETDAFSALKFGARFRKAGTSSIEITASYTLDW